MKNGHKILLLFFLSQLIGLLVLTQYIDFEASARIGETITTPIYAIEPLEVQNESYSFIFILAGIFIATLFLLLIFKYNITWLWKSWYALSVFVTVSVSLWALLHHFIPLFAIMLIISAVLTYLKLRSKNLLIHNVTEVLIYGGLAALFVPVINLTSAIILLIIIAIYDYWMVFQSKHMVTLVKGQMNTNIVAGLMVDQPQKKVKQSKKQSKGFSPSFLGGGDIAFPLIFAGALMKHTGLILTGVVAIHGAMIGLLTLFILAQKKTFYPAMPFISAGCLLSLVVLLIV